MNKIQKVGFGFWFEKEIHNYILNCFFFFLSLALFQSYLGGEVPVQNGNGENNNIQQDEQTLNLHDEFMQLCKSVGLEDLAKKQGFIQNNAIPDLKTYASKY